MYVCVCVCEGVVGGGWWVVGGLVKWVSDTNVKTVGN